MSITANLKIIKPVSENDAQKVATLNGEADDLDAAVAGMLTLSIAGTGDVPIGTYGRTQAMNAAQKFTGVLTGNRTIYLPVVLGCPRNIMVWNATTGAFSLTFKTTVGGSVGVTVTQTKKVWLFHDGTDVYKTTTEV